MINSMEVGDRLRHLRAKASLLQKQFAAEIMTAEQTYRTYESGKGLIPIHRAAMLVEKYGVTLDWLYLGKEKE